MKWHSFRSTFLLIGLMMALILANVLISCGSDNPLITEYMNPESVEEIIETVIPRTDHQKKLVLPKVQLAPPDFSLPREIVPVDDMMTESDDLDVLDLNEIDFSSPFNASDSGMVSESTPPPLPLPVEDNAPIVFAEKMPALEECSDLAGEQAKKTCTEKHLMKIIYDHLIYPKIARENGIEGMVVVRFIVGKKGQLEDLEIVRDIGGNCGEAALKAVQRAERWTPGYQNGRPVRVMYTIPIRFDIQE